MCCSFLLLLSPHCANQMQTISLAVEEISPHCLGILAQAGAMNSSADSHSFFDTAQTQERKIFFYVIISLRTEILSATTRE